MSEQNLLDVPAEQPAENAPPAAAGQSILENQPAVETVEIPEAFRVMNGDTLDYTATANKLAEAYQARAAFGEVPANDAEYNPVDLGGGAKWEEVKELDAVKTFTEEARKLGMTHEQYAFALKTIAAAELDGRNYAQNQNKAASEEALRAAWAEPSAYAKNIKAAGAALRAFVPAAEHEAFTQRYGNDATVIKLLAKMGAEISEDSPLGLASAVPTAEDVKTLMRSEAYLNSAHPEHAAVMAKVNRFYSHSYSDASAI